jgi:hypothetical protein
MCCSQHTFLLDAYQYQHRVCIQDVPHRKKLLKSNEVSVRSHNKDAIRTVEQLHRVRVTARWMVDKKNLKHVSFFFSSYSHYFKRVKKNISHLFFNTSTRSITDRAASPPYYQCVPLIVFLT